MIETPVIGLPRQVITPENPWPGLDFAQQGAAYSTTADTLAFAGQSVTAIAGRASGADAVATGLISAGTVAGRMAGADVVGALLQSAGTQAQRA